MVFMHTADASRQAGALGELVGPRKTTGEERLHTVQARYVAPTRKRRLSRELRRETRSNCLSSEDCLDFMSLNEQTVE